MNKFKRKSPNVAKAVVDDSHPKSAVTLLFQTFAVELEEKQDRYERLVKISRDITVESKRLIFFLHTHKRGTPEGEKVLHEARARLTNIVKFQFSKILEELDERDIFQFLKSFSFGVQEFIEAFSFYHYLLTETLLTYNEVQHFLQSHSQFKTGTFTSTDSAETSQTVDKTPMPHLPQKEQPTAVIKESNHHIITMVDYVLGLNDLTGELMRYSINQVAYGEIQAAFDICRFLTNLYTGMLSVSFNNREYSRKLFTVMQSVKKVEMACYTVRVRGSEMPKRLIFSVLEDENVCGEDSHF